MSGLLLLATFYKLQLMVSKLATYAVKPATYGVKNNKYSYVVPSTLPTLTFTTI